MNTLTLDGLLEAYAQVSVLNKSAIDQFSVIAHQFQRRQVDCILLKGADLISRLYGLRGLRPMTDVDLLVHETDLPAIDDTLKGLGYLPQINGNPAYHSPTHALTLDIITSIWYLDTPEALDGLWQRATPRLVGGRGVKGMGSDDLLIYLTAYAVLHRGALSPQFARDIALLAEKEPLNWAFILDEAARHNLCVPLHHGLSYARSRESIPELPDCVLEQLAPSNPGEKVLAFMLRRLVTERVTDGIGHFLLLMTRPGLKMKCQWGYRSLFPSEAFLAYRYGEPGTASPLWTRLTRVLHLFTRGYLLCVQMILLLFRRSRPTP